MFTITQILLHKIMHSDNADEYLIYHYTFEKVSNVEVFILFKEVWKWLTYSLRAGLAWISIVLLPFIRLTWRFSSFLRVVQIGYA